VHRVCSIAATGDGSELLPWRNAAIASAAALGDFALGGC